MYKRIGRWNNSVFVSHSFQSPLRNPSLRSQEIGKQPDGWFGRLHFKRETWILYYTTQKYFFTKKLTVLIQNFLNLWWWSCNCSCMFDNQVSFSVQHLSVNTFFRSIWKPESKFIVNLNLMTVTYLFNFYSLVLNITHFIDLTNIQFYDGQIRLCRDFVSTTQKDLSHFDGGHTNITCTLGSIRKLLFQFRIICFLYLTFIQLRSLCGIHCKIVKHVDLAHVKNK